jgi:hypothetical protein
MSYVRFGLMIATSTVVMFILMYLNTYAWEHVFFSETRTYMAIMMGATMAFIMLAYMLGMYSSTMLNVAIFAGAVVVFVLSLWLVRAQVTVSGPSYMRAMIPHHSIAIMTSERAQIRDPRVRKLADEIIEAQRREIAERAISPRRSTATRPPKSDRSRTRSTTRSSRDLISLPWPRPRQKRSSTRRAAALSPAA